MRKSIFDIAAQSINMSDEVDRLLSMATKENTLIVSGLLDYTLFQFVEDNCFPNWKQRKHFLNVSDYLKTIHFDNIVFKARSESESLITLIELIYNFWYLSYLQLNNNEVSNVGWHGNYYHLHDVMDDILSKYNHTAFFYEEGEYVLVVEDKPEVTAVAEIVPENLSGEIVRYNHKTLKGDIEQKKSILNSFSNELEPKRGTLKRIDGRLDNIFPLFNKLNIRHNNRDIKNKAYYIESVAKMTDEQLEYYYDELYQMVLLAFLQLDSEERLKNAKELVRELSGGNQ